MKNELYQHIKGTCETSSMMVMTVMDISEDKQIAVVSFFPSFSFAGLLQKENQDFSLGIPAYRP